VSTLIAIDLIALTILHHSRSILIAKAAFVRFRHLAFDEAGQIMRWLFGPATRGGVTDAVLLLDRKGRG